MIIDGWVIKFKKKFLVKYVKVLRIYYMWYESEFYDMSDEFVYSIKVGMKLGVEVVEWFVF